MFLCKSCGLSSRTEAAANVHRPVSLLPVENPVEYFAVGLINLALVKVDVDVRHGVVAVTQGMGDCVTRYVKACGDCSPRVACPVSGDVGEHRFCGLLATATHSFVRPNLLQGKVDTLGVVM